MPAPGLEMLGWTEKRWQAVQNALEKALPPNTAKCRQVIPKGPDIIGHRVVVVPNIGGAPPIAYGPDIIATPVQIYVDVTLDDQHAETEEHIIRLISAAAAQVGTLEDEEIVRGGVPPVPGPGAGFGRVPRHGGLARLAAQAPPAGAPAPVLIGAVGMPNGTELFAAIANAVAALEATGRAGQFALLLHNSLMAILRQPRVPGGVPLIKEVQGLVGSDKIAGTSALDGTFVPLGIGAILFRLEPPAMDIVHTQLPRVTVMGRAGGLTNLRVEEDIALRILEPAAVQRIAY
jgi:hypothetical protein